MKRKQSLYIIFAVCLILSLTIFALTNKSDESTIGMVIQFIFSPIQKPSMKIFHSLRQESIEEQLNAVNIELKTQLAKDQLLLKDNTALRDQFQTMTPSSRKLIPADIVGMPSLFPGVSFPEELILDKGSQDGIIKGNVVVYKDNLIGIITKTNNHFSLVTVVGNKETSFTAKTSKTNALGIIKGEGNGQMLLDNVVLSDTLDVNDMVVTIGDTALSGKGYPSGLIIGEITSIEKNPSSLFQKANVQSLIDVTRIPIVFIMVEEN